MVDATAPQRVGRDGASLDLATELGVVVLGERDDRARVGRAPAVGRERDVAKELPGNALYKAYWEEHCNRGQGCCGDRAGHLAGALDGSLGSPQTLGPTAIDGLEDGSEKDRLIADLDELQRTTDFIIREARRPIRREEEEWCDLGTAVAERSEFWLPLAVEQDRWVTIDVTDDTAWVAVPHGDIEAVVDALIENAISHTPASTTFHMSVTTDDTSATLTIDDGGPGFPDRFELERGSSHADSTGLGLDIVRRTVEASDGTLEIGRSASLGGAQIRLMLPLAENR